MFLKELYLFQFKNILELNITFDSPISFFCGNNGAGKTNLLDAIYYLSFTKSFLNFSDTENIAYNKDFFRIHGKYMQKNDIKEFSCVVNKDGKKQFRYFEKEYSRLYEHIGKIPLVIISPSDILYIIEGSELRRKLLDSMISQINYDYLLSLVEYNRILKQRNSLLKSEQDFKTKYELLEIYDNQLLPLGTNIYHIRKNFLDKLLNEFITYYKQLAQNTNEQATFLYKSQLNSESFNELLLQSKEKDIATEFTNVGIHKDDVVFLLNDKPIKYFASQGQQKSFLTAFKLSYTQLLIKENLEPIVLLDDVFDKLDEHRVLQLFLMLTSFGCQSFITHTEKHEIKKLTNSISENVIIFELNNGKLV